MNGAMNNRFVRLLFFGNYFYGVCAVALSVEASLQQRFPLDEPLFYVLVFAATVLFYTLAYMTTEVSRRTSNARSAWYGANAQLVRKSQRTLLALLVAGGGYFVAAHWRAMLSMGLLEYGLLAVFPLVSCLYYGISLPGMKIVLRNVGWLKPFIIGFSWAGMVTVYPVLYYQVVHASPYTPTWVGLFLFIKNFMFITLLCIMFDIKDYEMDYNAELKTIVVKLGLWRTIFYIIIPLCVLGLACFLGYAFANGFHGMKILLNTIPFVLVIVVAWTMHYRRSIFYYLAVIDGLMLVKAVCGSVAMMCF